MKILHDEKKHILEIDLNPILTKNANQKTCKYNLPKGVRNISEYMEMKNYQNIERKLIKE